MSNEIELTNFPNYAWKSRRMKPREGRWVNHGPMFWNFGGGSTSNVRITTDNVERVTTQGPTRVIV